MNEKENIGDAKEHGICVKFDLASMFDTAFENVAKEKGMTVETTLFFGIKANESWQGTARGLLGASFLTISATMNFMSQTATVSAVN